MNTRHAFVGAVVVTCFLAGHAGPLRTQTPPPPPMIGVVPSLEWAFTATGGGNPALGMGADLEFLAGSTWSPFVGMRYWHVGGGCAAVGLYDCDTQGVSVHLGGTFRPTPPGSSVRPFASARLGGIRFDRSARWMFIGAFGAGLALEAAPHPFVEAAYELHESGAASPQPVGAVITMLDTRDWVTFRAGVRIWW